MRRFSGNIFIESSAEGISYLTPLLALYHLIKQVIKLFNS